MKHGGNNHLVEQMRACRINTAGHRLSQLMMAATVLLAATGCLKAPYDRSAVEKTFFEQSHTASDRFRSRDRSIHYVSAGKRGAPLVVLIHGTPGSWHAFGELMIDDRLISKTHLVAVDRPGFGKSGSGRIVTSLARQAAYVQPVIDRESAGGKAILVGHSLGAPIAARIAMDYPHRVAGVVLVAPSLDPDLEKPRWFNHMAASALLAWAVPEELALANKEIMTLSSELTKMLPSWSQVHVPVIVVQGERNKLVLPANADFAQRMISSQVTQVRVADQGHFILWNRPDLIRKQILALVQQLEK